MKANTRPGFRKLRVFRSYFGSQILSLGLLVEGTSLLERNQINFLESFRRRDQQDQEPQHETGHALMASTSKSKALLIDFGASNHMMDKRDSFSYLETSKSIPIHLRDDSTIISEGQGTVDLENDYFQLS